MNIIDIIKEIKKIDNIKYFINDKMVDEDIFNEVLKVSSVDPQLSFVKTDSDFGDYIYVLEIHLTKNKIESQRDDRKNRYFKIQSS